MPHYHSLKSPKFAAALVFALVLAMALAWIRGDWPALVCSLVLFALLALATTTSGFRLGFDLPTSALLLLPAVGLIQLTTRATAAWHATLIESVHWAALAAVFVLARQHARERHDILTWVEVFGAAAAVLCLLQMSTSQGRVLWTWDTGYQVVFATLPYSNNWAQFGELVLPIALWRALRPDHRDWHWHALAAGVIFASIIAAASRAGTVLALAEVAAIGVFSFWNRAAWPFRSSASIAALPVLALLFAWASDIENVSERFRESSLLEGRREFVASALEMARVRPIAGHGLGSFDRVYPAYATIDFDGLYVNHAHNDWAEFAAEGGLPFLFFAALATLPVLARIRKEPWLTGTAAFLIHAFVDYPFARLATAGWFFLLAGLALPPPDEAPSRLRRIAAGTLACAAVFVACFTAAADFLYRLDTTESVQGAIAMMPDNPRYVRRLAELDAAQSQPLLEQARRLDPLDTRVMIELALRAEQAQRPQEAEQLLLQAARADQTAFPRWTLLNFYVRQDRPGEFWHWLPGTLRVMTGESKAVFDLARRFDSKLERTAALLPQRAPILRGFLDYAIDTNEYSYALAPALSLIAQGAPARERPFLLGLVNLLIRDHRSADALAVWSRMLEQGWIPRRSLASLSREPLQAGFDWRLYFPEGVTPATRGDQLEITFDGRQEEACVPAEIYVPVEPGREHRFHYRFQTDGIPPGAGLIWQFIDPHSGRQMIQSASLSSGGASREEAVSFTPESPLVRIQLLYRRQLGTSRIRGSVRLEQTDLSMSAPGGGSSAMTASGL